MSVRDWFESARAGDLPELKPWEKLELIEFLATEESDDGDLAARLLDGPFPAFKLTPLVELAVEANPRVLVALLDAGATPPALEDVCRPGFAAAARRCVEQGVRLNRRYKNAAAPIHLAAIADDEELVGVLVDAGCDLTVRDPDGRTPSELAAATRGTIEGAVGRIGPTWFREAQATGVDFFMLYDEAEQLAFNPNDVQQPILTGDESDGFGWSNTAQQAVEWLEDRRLIRLEIEWFLPLLDKLVAGEDFGLDALGPRVPRRRLSF